MTALSTRLEEQNAPRRFQTLLLSLFAALALGLAGAGIFAMVHYTVAQRTREIGIRMALGASRAAVIGMVLDEGLVLVAVGCGIGLAGSLLFSRFIRSLLFEVGPGDPATLSAVSLLLEGIVLLACYIPARRATRVDPVIALRCELGKLRTRCSSELPGGAIVSQRSEVSTVEGMVAPVIRLGSWRISVGASSPHH